MANIILPFHTKTDANRGFNKDMQYALYMDARAKLRMYALEGKDFPMWKILELLREIEDFAFTYSLDAEYVRKKYPELFFPFEGQLTTPDNPAQMDDISASGIIDPFAVKTAPGLIK